MLKKKQRDTLPGLVQRICRRYFRDILLVLGGIFMVAAVAFAVSGFQTGNRGRVFAVNLRSERGGYQSDFQAGLMGVVNGVSDMERYSRNVRLYHVTDDEDGILAGAAAVKKLALHRAQIKAGTEKASELGYYAWLTLEESQMPKEDYDTLLKIVEAEATGGDVMSKMMVASVVLNRVRDPRFPDTISEVVWQRLGGNAQFQPTQDGRIYSCEVTDSTVEAVDRVLSGEDYSQGALFFLARNASDSSSAAWFDSTLVKLFEYGGHEYYTFGESGT